MIVTENEDDIGTVVLLGKRLFWYHNYQPHKG